MGLFTKSDCMTVTDLNQTVRDTCHVVDICCKLHKDFHDYCLIYMFDQLDVEKVFQFLLNGKPQKNCVKSKPFSSTFASKSH